MPKSVTFCCVLSNSTQKGSASGSRKSTPVPDSLRLAAKRVVPVVGLDRRREGGGAGDERSCKRDRHDDKELDGSPLHASAPLCQPPAAASPRLRTATVPKLRRAANRGTLRRHLGRCIRGDERGADKLAVAVACWGDRCFPSRPAVTPPAARARIRAGSWRSGALGAARGGAIARRGPGRRCGDHAAGRHPSGVRRHAHPRTQVRPDRPRQRDPSEGDRRRAFRARSRPGRLPPPLPRPADRVRRARTGLPVGVGDPVSAARRPVPRSRLRQTRRSLSSRGSRTPIPACRYGRPQRPSRSRLSSRRPTTSTRRSRSRRDSR